MDEPARTPSDDDERRPDGPVAGSELPPREPGRRSQVSVAINDNQVPPLMTASMMDMPILVDASSSPASPGQDGAESGQAKPSSSFVPPTRPSSTPFPHPENRSQQVCCLAESDMDPNANLSRPTLPVTDQSPPSRSEAVQFEELPMEVHEAIVDHLFGFRISPTSNSATRIASLTKSWGSALRHSRRRELSSLALVNKRWTYLIQQRLYRHIKLKATVDYVEDAIVHFATRQHLAPYVKHVEIWFPVFQPMYGPLATSAAMTLPTVTSSGLTNATYALPSDNCTLEEVFRFITLILPEAQVLTLEGGERRKAPMVAHFNNKRGQDTHAAKALRPIQSVRTLVTGGQWNLMRAKEDMANIMQALPNLEEWQASYSRPKSKSYITLSEYIEALPPRVKRLNLCMENDYRRESLTPSFYTKVIMRTHICCGLGQIVPQLEHFSYTGRVCHVMFDQAARLGNPVESRLRSVDLTVKNCCRDVDHPHDFVGSGSGIHEMGFIDSFELLVVSAIRFLEKHKLLQFLRIRFVDLDSLLPPLNPYFMLQQGKCTGVWSNAIIAEMARVRPSATFAELSETFGNISFSKEGRMIMYPEKPPGRISSLKLSNYQTLANGMPIH
ncbi:hypothetical protein DCS_04585 [Drechmeria coniospora]|uniref:Uncharacterized protein n=1 Tax=Drechmeria coniospora TaxID=98403 RepID=A0A151GKE3_DRECN|nr:hypothetical protein DCS_04585 [Drechmeria coniospora]KYK57574.1 hypothetical protein DCS_04585 [Drechmeria coniospora]ODA79464.1 hypothetical protein RJ55_05057 [Drechmeria coniospora]